MEAWKIAAAILIDKDIPIHYTELTKLVLDTNLSKLGYKNTGTEHLTMNTYMTRDHGDFFIRKGNGYFVINPSMSDDRKLLYAKSKYSEYITNLKERQITESKLQAEEKNLEIITEDIKSFNLEHNINDNNINFTEGTLNERYISYYERNSKLRAAAIKIHGTKCMVSSCGFDFENVYGERGKQYIEVHHIKPLSELVNPESINPEKDLVVVCSNCHRIIHRKKDSILTIEQVDKLITQNRIK